MISDSPLITKLLSLNLPSNDYAVFGSGPMWAHGLKDLCHDLDLIARGTVWEKALTLGPSIVPKSGVGLKIPLFNGAIEIFNTWWPGTWDIDKLIDEAEVIEGIRFVKLEEVVRWKRIYNRKTDNLHIRIIEEYLKNKK